MTAKLKNAPDNLTNWDLTENSVASLTDRQKFCLSKLEDELSSFDISENENNLEITLQTEKNEKQEEKEITERPVQIEKFQELLWHYASIENKFTSAEYVKYKIYLDQLKERWQECHELCLEIEEALDDLFTLNKQYTEVSGKTMSLYDASEQLISDQRRLNSTIANIAEQIKHFKEINSIMEKMEAPTLSVNSDAFFEMLDKIDTNIDVMKNNPSYKESGVYLVKYKHCQSKAITSMQNYIFDLFDKTTESILNLNEAKGTDNSDAALALFYGRFQTTLSKVKPVIRQIEARSYKRQEYDTSLSECHRYYWNKRGLVLGPSIQKSLLSVKEEYNGDHCSLVRHSCALLLHASVDEHRLFYEFFSKPTTGLTSYLESLCTSLYDTLRPFIIHINHLETLAEICCILRIEMLDEHVQNNFDPLEGFGNICLQLLHDVQERLVFRAHLYLRSDVLNYDPSPGDLAYPEKLKMMEDIAESLREETRKTRIKKISTSSIDSNALESISRSHIMDAVYHKFHPGSSPADLHGMWYPTVRRTLVCLSRLYRCLDRSVFQSLSQEAISLCVQSIENAKNEIEKRATILDAELFQIKHLLILREQIAPFQVDFTIKEYSLDFSKVKAAAFGLFEKSSRLFTLSNNALLEFLLEGTPQMKEQLVDSKKHVDTKLKFSCQRFVKYATQLLINPIIGLLEKENMYVERNGTNTQENPLGSAQDVAAVIGEALRTIRFKLPQIQQSMQLYLANKETEFILFRPIKNNIAAAFTQLHQLSSKYFSSEEFLLIACPLPEQISIILSSSSLIQGKQVQHINVKPEMDKETMSDALYGVSSTNSSDEKKLIAETQSVQIVSGKKQLSDKTTDNTESATSSEREASAHIDNITSNKTDSIDNAKL